MDSGCTRARSGYSLSVTDTRDVRQWAGGALARASLVHGDLHGANGAWGAEGGSAVGELVELRVDAAMTSLPLVRTMAAAIAMRQDYDIDSIADLKLVVDEACSLLVRRAVPGTRLVGRFSVLADSLTFRAAVAVLDTTPLDEESIGWKLLTALVDSVATTVHTNGTQAELSVEVLITRRSAPA